MGAGTHELNGLDAIAEQVERGEEPEITGRELLRWFNAERRGSSVVANIRRELKRRKLRTDPDFNEVWVDVPIRVKSLPPETKVPMAATGNGSGVSAITSALVPSALGPGTGVDPVHRIGRLSVANQGVVSVPPETSLKEAMTLMMLKDFSQLPVIQNERDCKGAVSWQSIAENTALGRECKTVNDCLVQAEQVQWSTGLLEAIPKIVAGNFVLVRGPDRLFTGIVTVADLSLQFRSLSEPFLLLGQIENSLRVLAAKTFTIEDLRQAKDPHDASRDINDVSDLSFGEYVGLLEPLATWPKLKFTFDRQAFLKELGDVRKIRNDVMHFNPEPLESSDLSLLRNVAAFLERVIR